MRLLFETRFTLHSPMPPQRVAELLRGSIRRPSWFRPLSMRAPRYQGTVSDDAVRLTRDMTWRLEGKLRPHAGGTILEAAVGVTELQAAPPLVMILGLLVGLTFHAGHFPWKLAGGAVILCALSLAAMRSGCWRDARHVRTFLEGLLQPASSREPAAPATPFADR